MLSKPAKIAYIIMFFAVFVFCGSAIAVHMVTEDWQKWILLILHHGSEGALVGGVCDIIAVQNVYRAANENYKPLIRSTSHLVVKDFIQIRDIIQKGTSVREWIRHPKNQEFLLQLLDSALPTREKLEKDLETFWNEKIEAKMVHWMLSADLVSFLFGSKEGEVVEDHPNESLDEHVDEHVDEDIHQDLVYLQEVKKKGFFNTRLMKDVFADELEQIANNQELADDFVVQIQSIAEALTLSDLGIPSDPVQLKHLANELWNEWSSLQDSGRVKNAIAQTAISSIVPWLAPKVESTTLADILQPTLQPKQVQNVLHRFAERIRKEAEQVAEDSEIELAVDTEKEEIVVTTKPVHIQDLTKALLGYARAFAEAWQNMPQEKRQLVVMEIVAFTKNFIITSMSEGVWMLREKIIHPQNLLEQPWVEALLQRFEDEIQKNSDQIETKSINALQSQLENYGPDKFTQLLQSKTQERLDWIKVNGTGFGFIIGGFAGLISLLIEHLL